MSTTLITIERVNQVRNHPNADKLDIIQVLGFQVVCGRDQFKVGDSVVYFPPDILLPTQVAQDLGVAKYLKHAVYPGDTDKTQCRVAACRLRGVPSHGFVISCNAASFGVDVTRFYNGVKYEPPKRAGAGDAEKEAPNFHKYTDVENIQRYPVIPDGTMVRITEKIHGTNCRVGLIKTDNGFEFAAGSHKVRRKAGLYWEPLTDKMKSMLTEISNGKHDVIVFGEIFGKGVQDLDYGQTSRSFRVFDISVNGVYMNWSDVEGYCKKYDIPLVPVLYVGPFSSDKVEELTYGDTTFKTNNKFKGREGCVITPLNEQICEIGRMILKSISADYRDRKGAKDLD